MRFDISDVLNQVADSLVVGENVDLTEVTIHGIKPFGEPVAMNATACIKNGVVSLDCSYNCTLSLVCDRCLKPFDSVFSLNCSHIVVREISNEDSEEYLIAPDGVVELDELATNDILPELPTRYLCSEDCKGLCPICGKNLNQGECDCTPSAADSPFASILGLFE